MRELTRTEYNTIHKYHLRHWTKTGICQHCNSKTKTEWANKSGLYIKDDRLDWLELCKKCHAEYDKQARILSSIDIEEQTFTLQDVRDMKSYDPLYKAIKQILTDMGHWKNKPRGGSFKKDNPYRFTESQE